MQITTEDGIEPPGRMSGLHEHTEDPPEITGRFGPVICCRNVAQINGTRQTNKRYSGCYDAGGMEFWVQKPCKQSNVTSGGRKKNALPPLGNDDPTEVKLRPAGSSDAIDSRDAATNKLSSH